MGKLKRREGEGEEQAANYLCFLAFVFTIFCSIQNEMHEDRKANVKGFNEQLID